MDALFLGLGFTAAFLVVASGAFAAGWKLRGDVERKIQRGAAGPEGEAPDKGLTAAELNRAMEQYRGYSADVAYGITESMARE